MDLDRKVLIAAWSSTETALDVADRLGITEFRVLTEWRRMKKTGELPIGDRPRSRQSNHRGQSHADGRPHGDDAAFIDLLNKSHPDRKPR